jgi:hypothetical protein
LYEHPVDAPAALITNAINAAARMNVFIVVRLLGSPLMDFRGTGI